MLSHMARFVRSVFLLGTGEIETSMERLSVKSASERRGLAGFIPFTAETASRQVRVERRGIGKFPTMLCSKYRGIVKGVI